MNKKKDKKNNTIFTILIIIFAFVFIFSLFKLTKLLLQYKREKAVNQQLVELLRPDDGLSAGENGSANGEDDRKILERYVALYETNNEMIGWIEIPGTQANGPVVQSPASNREKYLRLDFFGKSSISGTFFMDSNCDVENSDNLIIHGHRMNNGTMFGELNKYQDEAFWRENPTFTFDTLYKKQRWEVFAACYTRVPTIDPDKEPEEQDYNYMGFINASDEEEYKRYINFLREHMIYDTGIIPRYGEDRLLTLSTCKKNDYYGRFIVVARLIK